MHRPDVSGRCLPFARNTRKATKNRPGPEIWATRTAQAPQRKTERINFMQGCCPEALTTYETYTQCGPVRLGVSTHQRVESSCYWNVSTAQQSQDNALPCSQMHKADTLYTTWSGTKRLSAESIILGSLACCSHRKERRHQGRQRKLRECPTQRLRR